VIPDHKAFERALSPELDLAPPHPEVELTPCAAPNVLRGATPTSPAGSGPVLSTGGDELPDPVGALFAGAPGLAAVAWRRLEHFIKGYDARHDDERGHDKRKFSLFNLARQRLADAADYINEGRLTPDKAENYRKDLIYSAALLAAEIDRHDREIKASAKEKNA